MNISTPYIVPPQFIEAQPPDSGSTTGAVGLFLALTSFGELKGRVTKAFNSQGLEAKMIAVHEIIKAPFKLCIGFLSTISLLSTVAKFLTISIGVVLSPIVLATCALIFAIASTVYLGMELIRSIIILDKSRRFLNKEEIGTALEKIKLLNNLADQGFEKIGLTLFQNKKILRQHLGDEEYNTLTASYCKSANEVAKALKKAQAVLTYNKLNTLFTKYVAKDSRQTEYFARRIGNNAANAFSKRVQNITQYDLSSLKNMDDTKLDAFIEQGKSLLKMVNTQSKKVLKVHIFSVIVILAAGFSLAVSAKVIAIPVTMASIGITCFAGATSMARSFANDGYIDNPNKGISLRLSIPKSLSPTKEGERVWSIWRIFDHTNPHISRLLKCLYVFTSVILPGILPLFDGAIYKAEWVKRARGEGENYDLFDKHNTMRVPEITNRERSHAITR